MSDRIARMRRILEDTFAPEELNIHDNSHLHVGHAGARSGAGHYRLEIRSAAFNGLPPLQAHRKIYAALDEMMGSDIHALSIQSRGL